jgi:two-component system LytT family response regulator
VRCAVGSLPITVFVTAYDQYALEGVRSECARLPVETRRERMPLERVHHELATRDADEHRSRLLPRLGTLSGKAGLALDKALAHAT